MNGCERAEGMKGDEDNGREAGKEKRREGKERKDRKGHKEEEARKEN